MKILTSLLLAGMLVTPSKVFITEHGKVYHLYSDCRVLKHNTAHEIEIKNIGLRKLCEFCKKRSEKK